MYLFVFTYRHIIGFYFFKPVSRQATKKARCSRAHSTVKNLSFYYKLLNDTREAMLFQLDIQLDHVIDLVFDKVGKNDIRFITGR